MKYVDIDCSHVLAIESPQMVSDVNISPSTVIVVLGD